MTEQIAKRLNDSAAMRWTALVIVSLTMAMAYFFTDVVSPLSTMLKDSSGMGWTSDEYGFFSGSYSLINIFLLMLFFGGIILDRCGIRFTGLFATSLMFIGAAVKFYAIAFVAPTIMIDVPFTLFGMIPTPIKAQVLMASLGFAVFGMGCEIAGITASKIITKWFTGHELALAMGFQVALARLGTAAALALSPLIAKNFSLPAPILFGAVLLLIGLVAYAAYCVMDLRLDRSIVLDERADGDDDKFQLADLGAIFTNAGFWLIAFLCLLFYAGVFPFLKFASDLMVNKYGVSVELAGLIPSILPFGTILLTPLFGTVYDKIGHGATLMVIGSLMLTLCHVLFALPVLNYIWFAILVMVLLGIAFSLVPSAMWPSVPKLIPMRQLGSAYAIIFFIQNIGLMLVPMIMGKIIGTYTAADGSVDYTVPMWIFAAFGVAAVALSLMLLLLDGRRHYGLEQPNVKG